MSAKNVNAECLSDEVLSRLLLGSAGARADEHVEHCPACQERLEQLTSPDPAESMSARQQQLWQKVISGTVSVPTPRITETATDDTLLGSHFRTVDSTQHGEPPVLPKLPDYEFLYEIAVGGMGAVYCAHHRRLGRDVAIKVVRSSGGPEFAARFEREMKAVGQLSHPNIVQAFDAGEVAGVPFLVMELIDGHDLSLYVRRSSANASDSVAHPASLTIADACRYMCQAAAGLQAAHDSGLIHRDVKPSNLMLTKDGAVKLLDLGLASAQEKDATDGSLTDEITVLGTLDYMAPEQGRNAHAADERSDVYSVGCTLFALLTGRPPFSSPDHTTSSQKLLAHACDDRPEARSLNSKVPQSLSKLVQKMMSIDPADRPPSARRVAEELTAFTGHSASSPKPRFGSAMVAGFVCTAVTLTVIIIKLSGDSMIADSNVTSAGLSADANSATIGMQFQSKPVDGFEAEPSITLKLSPQGAGVLGASFLASLFIQDNFEETSIRIVNEADTVSLARVDIGDNSPLDARPGVLKAGDTFTAAEVLAGQIQYSHDGSQPQTATIALQIAHVAAQPSVTRVSVSDDGNQTNQHSLLARDTGRRQSISADGRIVVFESVASNLVDGDTNERRDIFAHDLATGQTELVSVSSAGTQGVGDSINPAVSRTGRFVVFLSFDGNLDTSHPTALYATYVRDRELGTTERIVIKRDENSVEASCRFGSISDNGRFVVVASPDYSPPDGRSAGLHEDIVLLDRQTGHSKLVSRSSDGQPADSRAYDCVMTPDGRHVAFSSWAINLAENGDDGDGDIFLFHCDTDELTCVSNGKRQRQAADFDVHAAHPSISSGVRYIAYINDPLNEETSDDAFVYDRQTDTTRNITERLFDTVFSASVSEDGRFVCFSGVRLGDISKNVNQSVTPRHLAEVYVFDQATEVIEKISAGAPSSNPSISADGRFVVYNSTRPDIVAGDTNNASDIFVHDRGVGHAVVRFVVTTDEAIADNTQETRGNSTLPLTAWPADAPEFARLPFAADKAAKRRKAWADYRDTDVEFTSTSGMQMSLILPGEFQMGATD